MNTFNSVTMKARNIKFGGNIYYWCAQRNAQLEFVHAPFRSCKLTIIELQAENGILKCQVDCRRSIYLCIAINWKHIRKVQTSLACFCLAALRQATNIGLISWHIELFLLAINTTTRRRTTTTTRRWGTTTITMKQRISYVKCVLLFCRRHMSLNDNDSGRWVLRLALDSDTTSGVAFSYFYSSPSPVLTPPACNFRWFGTYTKPKCAGCCLSLSL